MGDHLSQIQTTNALNRRCVVELVIDGEGMGNFVLAPNQTYSFERPLKEAKLFTFMRVKHAVAAEHNGSKLAPKGTGIKGNQETNGLVQVTFVPEKCMVDKRNRVLAEFNVQEEDELYLNCSEVRPGGRMSLARPISCMRATNMHAL